MPCIRLVLELWRDEVSSGLDVLNVLESTLNKGIGMISPRLQRTIAATIQHFTCLIFNSLIIYFFHLTISRLDILQGHDITFLLFMVHPDHQMLVQDFTVLYK